MKNAQILALATLLPTLLLAGCGGQPKSAEKAAPAGTEAQAVMLTCPVSGHQVSKARATIVMQDGKEVGLCCADCVEPFKSNPAKYMAAFEKGEGAGDVPESMK